MKRQSNRRLLSQLDDFDQDIIIGNTASNRQENVTVNEVTGDQEFTVGDPGSNSTTKENVVNVETWEDVSMEELIGKLVFLLTLSKIGSRTQFWTQLIVSLP